jgi:two-component system, cell cycle response regulator DivK
LSVLSLNGEQKKSSMDKRSDARPTVLVVEDFEDNRFMMRRLLEMSGYRVVEAVNGNQAVEAAEHERPDIILMDLSLPMLDGLAATRRIRAHDRLSKVPIVAVSAHDSADFHAEALAAGCNEYVTKPIDFDQLVQLLNRLTVK